MKKNVMLSLTGYSITMLGVISTYNEMLFVSIINLILILSLIVLNIIKKYKLTQEDIYLSNMFVSVIMLISIIQLKPYYSILWSKFGYDFNWYELVLILIGGILSFISNVLLLKDR